ncbi:MAG: hypothetical protein JO041_07020 [Acidobacteria bacterium]|nr:hypothetical protein [Acidobacteriota bacterium]
MKRLRRLLRKTAFYPFWKRLGHYPDFWYWNLRGRPARPPHLLKQRLVRSAAQAHHLRVLVEAGTYFGEMVSALKTHFEQIYTIEFDPRFAELAARRFRRFPGIHVLQGSSDCLIPQVLAQLNQPALFWLDAGYCAWNGSFADSSRLLTELNAILADSRFRHVVLIDDVVPFSGLDGTPDAGELMNYIQQQFPGRAPRVMCGILIVA